MTDEERAAAIGDLKANQAAIEAAGDRLGLEWFAVSVLATLIEASPDRAAAIKELAERQGFHVQRLSDQARERAGEDIKALALIAAAGDSFGTLFEKAVKLAAVSTPVDGPNGTKN